MKIRIVGAGNIGSALAGHFRKLGHSVLTANSRGPETLSQIARKTGATPAAISEAAGGVEPTSRLSDGCDQPGCGFTSTGRRKPHSRS